APIAIDVRKETPDRGTHEDLKIHDRPRNPAARKKRASGSPKSPDAPSPRLTSDCRAPSVGLRLRSEFYPRSDLQLPRRVARVVRREQQELRRGLIAGRIREV